MPCLRHTSDTFMPASASLRMATIWDSVNRDFRIVSSSDYEARVLYELPVAGEGKLTLRVGRYKARMLTTCRDFTIGRVDTS